MNCNMDKNTLRLLGLCVFYLLYLFFGAAIFSFFEYGNEKQIINELKSKRGEFLQSHKECLNDTDLEEFIVKILEANNRGISAITNLTVEPNWSFGQAVFFSGTVLTTIGYGHVSPLSEGAKLFCILFAIIGIPITLIMISACVERLLILTNKIYDLMKQFKCFLNEASGTLNMKLLTYTHLTLIFVFVLVVFFLVPAGVFSYVEKSWNFLDGLYYCFISLTTIGLGDYIPGDNHAQPYRVFYKIATTFYLIVGIMFVMLLLSVITQIPELNMSKLFSLEKKGDCDPERQLLASGSGVGLANNNAINKSSGSPKYSRQVDDEEVSQINQVFDGLQG